MNLSDYLPIRQGFLPNGNLVVEFQPVSVPSSFNFVEEFYGAALNKQQIQHARLIGLSPERMKLHAGSQQIQSQNEDDGEIEL